MTIAAEIKERGLAAVNEWALELDGLQAARGRAGRVELPRDGDPRAGRPRPALARGAAPRRRRGSRSSRASCSSARWVPLDTVGVYVPRKLVSTLVMCVVPAQVAGVRRIVVCTPPEGSGLIAAAAELLGVDEVWALGGAQAIGWLAYVERVDKIVGPGGPYVNDAKLEVSRDVAIDLPGGPSEVVVLGDGDERLIELELAAQAEHGHEAVCRTVDTLAEAEAIAPEHLVLLGAAERHADEIQNAGSVFVGPWSPVPAGDYATGGNHVLPTNGWARSVGGLGLETFLKPVTVQRLTEDGLAAIRPTVEALAAAEGMPAHAAAVRR